MFAARPVEFVKGLQSKNLVFAVIAAMMAYVIWHNERFLIEPLNPIWNHYRDLGVFLLAHGVAGGDCADPRADAVFRPSEGVLHQAAPGGRQHLRVWRAHPRSGWRLYAIP